MFVFLSSLLIVNAVSDLTTIEDGIPNQDCKTFWHEEKSNWITLCDEETKIIDDGQNLDKTATVEVRSEDILKEEGVTKVDDTVVDEIFETVENGFGIVPKEVTVLGEENTPLKEELPSPIKISPRRNVIEVFADKVDEFFSLTFRMLGLGRGEVIQEELILEEDIGDNEFEMNVYADQVVKDIHGLTKGFGIVTHPWIHPNFLDSYIDEVGVEDVTVRISHKSENYGRGFPPTNVHAKLYNNGAKVMVYIKGVPAEEGIAYCAEFSGDTCIEYEPNGPAKDLQKWKNYVKDIVSYYNSKGVGYFIIWNEPNYEIENWKEVCDSPSNCWMPTMEEFIDITVAGVEAIYEVNPDNEVGVDATSAFFGKLYFQNGTEAYVSPEIFGALEREGLKANHHFHNYNPDPYSIQLGGDEEYALSVWRNTDSYLGSNLDEFSDGLDGRGSINGDGIHAVSSAMALVANTVNFDVDRMGWFQLNSDTHEPGTIEGRFLGWDENMIDRSGIFKPVFWLSKLLHESPGTLLVDDDLDESGIVRAFVVRNEEGTSYCMYAVNFNRLEESATIHVNIQGLPTSVSKWNYKTYKIGKDDGNPYNDNVEPEIEALLQPMMDSIENAPGATWSDYIDEAWPTISEINKWESVRPTETRMIIAGNKEDLSTRITLEAQEIRIMCIDAVPN